MGIALLVPGLKPGRPGRNSLVGAVYLLVLALVVSVVRVGYRPVRGC